MVYLNGRYLHAVSLSLLGVLLWSCHDNFMASSTRSKTTPLAAISNAIDEAGNITGTIDPNSSVTQVLGFNSGSLAGSAVAIPPGSLSLPLVITVGEGETLSSSEFLQDLGVSNNNLTAAGPSVAFLPSQSAEANNPLVLSIPFTVSGGLALNAANDNIVVLYRWTSVVGGVSSHSMGIIPASEITIGKDKVSFQTTKFGVFQLAKSESKITERVNAQSLQPPAPKKDMSHPLFGTWGSCEGGAYFEEPIFEKPQFAHVRVNALTNATIQTQVNFVLRGKNLPLSMTKYTDADCTTQSQPVTALTASTADTVPIRGYLAEDLIDSTGAQAMYYKFEGSETCQAVYAVNYPETTVSAISNVPGQHLGFSDYFVSSRRVNLNWHSGNDVTLTMHDGVGCEGAGTSITPMSYSTGDGQPSYQGIYEGLKSTTNYSFKLTSADNSVCQNVMTTEIDVDDWSRGNQHIMPASEDVSVSGPRSVSDTSTTYKLLVSIDGLPPVDTYSSVIKNDDNQALVTIPADEAEGRVITVLTPPGCHFTWNNEQDASDVFDHLHLPLHTGGISYTDPQPNVVCDGKSQDQREFGGYPTMRLASKSMTLRITNGFYNMRHDLFASRDCAVGTRVSSFVEVGEVVLPQSSDVNQPEALKGTTAVDVTPRELFGTMFFEASVQAANNAASGETNCEFRNWVVGERRNLVGTSCARDSKIGVTKYERVKRVEDGSRGEKLYFCELDGDDGHGHGYGHTPDMRIPFCPIDDTTRFLKRL